ncbi:MAG: hypothetical protein U0X86_000574 [Wolbachia endosymbiont of Xenopsylla cheopis]
MESNNLDDVCALAIKHNPDSLGYCATEIMDNVYTTKVEEEGIFNYIFTHKPNLIPKLLKVMSDSAVDTFSYIDMEEWIIRGELEPEIVNNVEEALKKYCTGYDVYHVEPHYLLPIKDHANFKKLKQCFKDTYNAIESNDSNKVENGLKQIKENTHKYNIGIDTINKVLTGLIKEAKLNEKIARSISDFQADITYPEPHLQNANVSNGEVKGKDGVQNV